MTTEMLDLETVTTNIALIKKSIIQEKTSMTPGIALSQEINIQTDASTQQTAFLYKDEGCHVRFSLADGWCMLTGLSGGMGSLVEGAVARTDPTGNWELFFKRGSNDLSAQFRAVMIDRI